MSAFVALAPAALFKEAGWTSLWEYLPARVRVDGVGCRSDDDDVFHGDLRETREISSPLLPAPPQSASSRPRAEHATPARAQSVAIGCAFHRASCGSPRASSIQSGSSRRRTGAASARLHRAEADRPHARLPHERKTVRPTQGRRAIDDLDLAASFRTVWPLVRTCTIPSAAIRRSTSISPLPVHEGRQAAESKTLSTNAGQVQTGIGRCAERSAHILAGLRRS